MNSEKARKYLQKETVMPDSPLIVKSKAFALQIIRVCNEIKNTKK